MTGRARACWSVYMVVTISVLVIIIRTNVAEIETETAAMESGVIVTGIANGIGIGIGTTRDLGPSYASGGQRAKATIPRATVMTETGGRSGRIAGVGIASWSVTGIGMAIGKDRGDTNASVGPAGMAGAHEVLNTEEGMHDDILAGCAYYSNLVASDTSCTFMHPYFPSSTVYATVQFRSVNRLDT